MKRTLAALVVVGCLTGCAGWEKMSGDEQRAEVERGAEAIAAFVPPPFGGLILLGASILGNLLVAAKRPSEGEPA